MRPGGNGHIQWKTAGLIPENHCAGSSTGLYVFSGTNRQNKVRVLKTEPGIVPGQTVMADVEEKTSWVMINFLNQCPSGYAPELFVCIEVQCCREKKTGGFFCGRILEVGLLEKYLTRILTGIQSAGNMMQRNGGTGNFPEFLGSPGWNDLGGHKIGREALGFAWSFCLLLRLYPAGCES